MLRVVVLSARLFRQNPIAQTRRILANGVGTGFALETAHLRAPISLMPVPAWDLFCPRASIAEMECAPPFVQALARILTTPGRCARVP